MSRELSARMSAAIAFAGLLFTVPGLVAVIRAEQVDWLSLGAIATGLLLLVVAFVREWDLTDRVSERIWGPRVEQIRHCASQEVVNVHEIACRKLGAGPSTLTSKDKDREIQRIYPDAIHVAICKGRYGIRVVGGYYMAFPIGPAAVQSIRDGSFEVARIAPDQIIASPEDAAAMYVGGVAAIGARAWYCLLGAMYRSAADAGRTQSKTAYARAATELGKRSLEKYGFAPVNPQATAVGSFYQRVFDD